MEDAPGRWSIGEVPAALARVEGEVRRGAEELLERLGAARVVDGLAERATSLAGGLLGLLRLARSDDVSDLGRRLAALERRVDALAHEGTEAPLPVAATGT